jgi:hypothetical protein
MDGIGPREAIRRQAETYTDSGSDKGQRLADGMQRASWADAKLGRQADSRAFGVLYSK